jgi:3-isopropylmalate/(R)-2-methylmalate dehydratase small subunit
MEKVSVISGRAVPMPWPNIDTGLLAHSQYCRDHPNDLRGGLFRDWRFDAEGRENKDFILAQPRYEASKVIVAGPNFGCGSSRETAVWALMQSGFRAVIAASFGDIFRDNAFQNGLLTIMLQHAEVERLMAVLQNAPEPLIEVSLIDQTVEAPGVSLHFDIAADRRAALLEGLDETLVIGRSEAKISAFQARDRIDRPWLYVRDGAGSIGREQ